jgi:5-carboxymethyl-2-hydroxymuconate isomerase
MPHIHLETTADLHENADVPDILEALVVALSGFETVAPASIKAYHTLRSVWHVGEGHPAGFAHCQVGILTGRPIELRQQMADGLYAVLLERFAMSLEAGEVAVTLELREMDAPTYRK